jgi:hypothetical protein
VEQTPPEELLPLEEPDEEDDEDPPAGAPSGSVH